MEKKDNVTHLVYKSTDFIQPAHDPNGMGTRMSFRCASSLKYQVDLLFDTGCFPYNTKTELVRHALFEHVKRLHDMKPFIDKEKLGYLKNTIMMLQNEQETRHFNTIREMLTEAVGYNCAQGASGRKAATALVIETLANLEYGEDVSHNAMHFHKLIREEHRDLLKGRKLTLDLKK